MEIIKNLVDKSKYGIKCPFAMTATRIVVHETANDASAENEINYMRTNNKEIALWQKSFPARRFPRRKIPR